jgi:hypothetical protein
MMADPLARSDRLSLPLRAHEKSEIREAAEADLMRISEWSRAVLLAAARRRLARRDAQPAQQ